MCLPSGARPVDHPAALASRQVQHPLLSRRLAWATTQATQRDRSTRCLPGDRAHQPSVIGNS
jgi:hypothetical protein